VPAGGGNSASSVCTCCANTWLSRCGNSVLPRAQLMHEEARTRRVGPDPFGLGSVDQPDIPGVYTERSPFFRPTACESSRPNAPEGFQ
jgi:hypothetical protein